MPLPTSSPASPHSSTRVSSNRRIGSPARSRVRRDPGKGSTATVSAAASCRDYWRDREMKASVSALLLLVVSAALPAQWVMVVNNTFLAAPNNSSVALVNRSDGSLVDKNWIVPAAGAGNWNGNCSAQDAVQVGSQ